MQKYNLKPAEFEAALTQIQEKCSYFFKSKDVLVEALTHSSFAGEHPGKPHNERLEFLGDSVLQLAATMEIFRKWPQANEGIMTRVRSLLTNEHATAEYTKVLGLDTALLLSKGENLEGGRFRESVLGDAFEAFLGAIYSLAVLIPGFAVFCRRMHDTGRSGWWWLIGLIPFVGVIVLLVFCCLDSQPGDNQYGPNPKGL